MATPDNQSTQEQVMKKALLAAAALVAFSGAALADPVRDWRDLEATHNHVIQAIREMEAARAANHYDMAGHGIKAEDLLRQAEHELSLAIQAAKAAK
jgi:hypothetical protein